MQPIKFFKLQAKNLYKDYKTQFTKFECEMLMYDYSPKYFDINGIIITLNLDEVCVEKFSLMKAQHIFAMLMGFDKWADLVNAPLKQQELLVLLFKNKIDIEDWELHIFDISMTDGVGFTYEQQIDTLIDGYLGGNTPFNARDTFLLHEF